VQADRASTQRLSISCSRGETKGSAFVVPAHLQSFPQFLVRDVQVPLGLLNAGVAEHQLDHTNVHAVGQQATRALMPEVVPAEVDQLEPLAIPPTPLRLDWGSTPWANSRSVSHAVWMFG